MKKQTLIFGKVRIPRVKRSQSGSYTSISWSKIKTRTTIKVQPPSYGNPLLEEKGIKGYLFSPSERKE